MFRRAVVILSLYAISGVADLTAAGHDVAQLSGGLDQAIVETDAYIGRSRDYS